MMKETIEDLFKEICRPGSIYDEIMDNIITPNFHLKPELISELAISFLGPGKSKINDSIKNGTFKYLFIRAVKSQIHSSTSPFHKNCRVRSNEIYDISDIIDDELSIDEIDAIRKVKVDKIKKALKACKITWFENEMFNLYFFSGEKKTYRDIEQEYDGDIDHVLAFKTVKSVVSKIRKHLKVEKTNKKK